MQTFLPYPNFAASAKCLDNKRLGKQRVECKQILVALGVGVGEHHGNTGSSWRNHPAVRMWRGGELYLCEYAEFMCREWRDRGFRDSLLPQFNEARQRCLASKPIHHRPLWMGDEAFHASHRSNLLRKDADYYSQFGWGEPDTLPYVWPVVEEVMA
jgi:hypothetical protein